MTEPTSPDVTRKWRTRVFVRWPRFLTAILILVAIGINFANVISRYLFDFALYWAEEVMVFIVVWCVFLGAVAVSFNGDHLKMDLLSGKFAPRMRMSVNTICWLVFVLGGGFVAYQSWTVVSLFAREGGVSVTASIPMFIPQAALLVGVVLMVLAVLIRARAYIRGRFGDED